MRDEFDRVAEDCSACSGTGSIGIPGGPCPYCRGINIARAIKEAREESERQSDRVSDEVNASHD